MQKKATNDLKREINAAAKALDRIKSFEEEKRLGNAVDEIHLGALKNELDMAIKALQHLRNAIQ